MIKLKSLLLEYFVVNGVPFLLMQDGSVVKVKEDHISEVANLFDLEDTIINRFQSDSGEEFNFGNDSDMEYFNEWVRDFMFQRNIFPIVVDRDTKTVYIRPVLSKKPNLKQIKYVKDWAIENGFNDDVKIDYAIA